MLQNIVKNSNLFIKTRLYKLLKYFISKHLEF